ncbi:unnamed protein product [Leuciscus chuanchicus]
MPNMWIKVIHTLQAEAVGNLTRLRRTSQPSYIAEVNELLKECIQGRNNRTSWGPKLNRRPIGGITEEMRGQSRGPRARICSYLLRHTVALCILRRHCLGAEPGTFGLRQVYFVSFRWSPSKIVALGTSRCSVTSVSVDIPESQHEASIGAECALPLSHRPTSRHCPDMTAHCVCPARPKPLAAGRN